MDCKDLSDGDFLTLIASLNSEFQRRFQRDLGVTGSIGEIIASQKWQLHRADKKQQEGFDATFEGKRIQIKCGVDRRPSDTCSKISAHDFDFLLYVHFNGRYEIKEAYLLTSENVKKNLTGKKKQLALSKIKILGVRVDKDQALPINKVA